MGVRGVHEAKSHAENAYCTFTYDDEHLPYDRSLRPKDMQLFWKRLRKRLGDEKKIKYMMCGEYGDESWRPHYHACVFGYCPSDLRFWCDSKGHNLYRSPFLEKVWGNGMVFVGDVTFQSAAYVGGYILKKVNGAMADEHYKRFDIDTGEIFWLRPEYICLSNGIGRSWFERFHTDWYVDGTCVVDGVKQKTPRYYDQKMEELFPEAMAEIRELRRIRASEKKHDNTPRRLRDREVVSKARAVLYGHK